jgi:hypothetical protein
MFSPYLIDPQKQAQIYQEERWRAAEPERLIRQARAQETGNNRYLHRFAGWLGVKMVGWGMRLQRNDPQAIQTPGDAD